MCSCLDNICCFTTLRIECTDNCFVHAKCKLGACLCSAGILSESSRLHLTVKVCRDKRTIFTSISFAYQSIGSTSGKINQNHRKLCSAFRRIPGESHISAPRARIWNSAEWESAKCCFFDSALLIMRAFSGEIPDKPERGCSAGLAGPRAAPLRGPRPAWLMRVLTINGFCDS